MRGVRFGGADMWECRTCSGLWVDRETVERLIAERIRPSPLIGTGLPQAKPEPVPVQPVKYAACPKCAKVMNRVNFGRSSGIIVDVCSHGTWFDADEMRRVLEFVAAGGLEAARARELADAREAAAMRPTPVDPSIFTNEIRHVRGSLGEGSVLSILVSYTRSRKLRDR
jgi:Zn-finger nucleic acid-binding protein